MTELERLDEELSRVEAEISHVEEQIFELDRRIYNLKDQYDREDDPRIKAEVLRQMGQNEQKLDGRKDRLQELNAKADEIGRQYRIEQALQDERNRRRKPDEEDGGGSPPMPAAERAHEVPMEDEEQLRQKRKIKL